MRVEKNAPALKTEYPPKQPEARPERMQLTGSGGLLKETKQPGNPVQFAIHTYVHKESGRTGVVLHSIKDSIALLREAQQATKLIAGILGKMHEMLKSGNSDAFAWEMLVKKLQQVAAETHFKGIHLLNKSARHTSLELGNPSHPLQVQLLDATAAGLGIHKAMQQHSAEQLERILELTRSQLQQLVGAEQIMQCYQEGKNGPAAFLRALYETESGAGKLLQDLPALRSAAEWAAMLMLQPEKGRQASIAAAVLAGVLLLIVAYIAAGSY
ncbi:hypothetical protein [Ectobacillus ponti]|uniref:Uncharacterized protein n=1 Tax=Ectobacillus ponti TaxID=2961894 RepID=A0AA42BPX7_9BACI|nr:hypothetical protein [Ectobacillus ponti]MCP8968831.1 hypothetical protein [Ectobacillus ponti]